MPMPATTSPPFVVGGSASRKPGRRTMPEPGSRRRTVSQNYSSTGSLAPARTARGLLDTSALAVRSPYYSDNVYLAPPPPYQPRGSRSSAESSRSPSVAPSTRSRRPSILSLARLRERLSPVPASPGSEDPQPNEGTTAAQVEIREYRECGTPAIAPASIPAPTPDAANSDESASSSPDSSFSRDESYRRGYEAGIRDALLKVNSLLGASDPSALNVGTSNAATLPMRA